MRLSTTAQALHDAVSLAAVITPSQPQMQAYGGVLLEVSGSVLLVRGSDGDTTVTVRCDISAGSSGSVLVPPKALLKYLATLASDTPVEVTSESATSVQVRAGSADPYKFTALAVSFPTQATPRRDKVSADLSGLAAAVDAVRDCAGSLSGGSDKVVQLVSSDAGLRLHSTDRFRLARALVGAGSGFGDFDGLLPLRVLDLVATVNPTHVQLDPKGRDMVFHSESVVISTRLAQDPFPVVDSVLNAAVPHTAVLHRGKTQAALRRLSAIAAPGGSLKVDVVGDQVALSVSNAVQGSGSEQLVLATPATGELSMLVNFDFFRSAISTHDQSQVTVGWIMPLKPLFITSTEPLPTTHAIMPQQG